MSDMFVRVWEYEVDSEQVDAFVAAYAATGDWAQLFGRGHGYVGTDLYRSTDDGSRFVTVDRWSDQAAWLAFLEDWREAYDGLDVSMSELTRSERSLVEGSA
jgi:heme-degrading monooxygenase HmoA